MTQKLLFYLGSFSSTIINENFLIQIKRYYHVIFSNNEIDIFADIIIIYDYLSFFLSNKIYKNNKTYIWHNDLSMLQHNIPNFMHFVNGVITTEQVNIPGVIYYDNNIEKILDIFGYQEKVITVKFLCNWIDDFNIYKIMLRLCKSEGKWNRIQITNSDDAQYYCILNHPQKGHKWKSENTILIMMEEYTNRKTFFPKEWISPKHEDFMCYEDNHNGIEWHLNKTWNELMVDNINKTKILSSVTSSEYRLEGHIKRILFLQFLDNNINFDLYGKSNNFNLKNYIGSLPFMNKDDGILPYKYTIACENNMINGYFTEKIVDAILGECLCFYWGCPNLEKFLDSRSFIRIDLDDHRKSLNIITDAIRNNEWEKRIHIIRIQKLKILNEIQLIPMIEKIINNHEKIQCNNLVFDDMMINSINELLPVEIVINFTLNRKLSNAISSLEKIPFYDSIIPINSGRKTLIFIDGSGSISSICDTLMEIFCQISNYHILIINFKNEYNYHHNEYIELKNIESILPKNCFIYFPSKEEWILISSIECHINLIKHELDNKIETKVINLKRRYDRWERFLDFTKHHRIIYNRFTAIDGRQLIMNDELDRIFKIPENFKGKRWQITHNWEIGVIGCAMSHINIWKELIQNDMDIYIIFEDDVILSQNFDNKIIKILNRIKNDNKWDIMFLGMNDDIHHQLYEDNYVYDNIMQYSSKMRIHGGGLYGYCLHKRGAIKLIDCVEKLGVQQPIDHFVIDQFDTMIAYKTVPPLVSAIIYGNENLDTDIQNVTISLKSLNK